MLYWEHFGSPPPQQSGKIMVCGHSSQRSGLPKNIGHAICIDKHRESCVNRHDFDRASG